MEKPSSEIEIAAQSSELKSVTRYTFRKREIGVIKTFAAVTKLNLGWSFTHY